MKRRTTKHRRGAISGRQLDRALLRAGFLLTRFHGSHAIYHHESGCCVVVPSKCLGRDVRPGMLARIAARVLAITGRELIF